MVETTWSPGKPLPIINARCGWFSNFAANFLDRGHLVFVDLRWRSGDILADDEGFLPHLAYTPDYEKTEAEKDEYTLTGNVSNAPIWRFDPAPFFANMSGSIVLTGGRGDAVFGVVVCIKRFAKMKPLRHTLTMATGRSMRRPFAASAVVLPDFAPRVSFSLGALSKDIATPNGGLVAMGPFDTVTFNPSGGVTTFEITLPC